MATRIVLNGREITNPFIKALLILGAIIVSTAVIAFVLFVLLPVIGVVVTLSFGFVFIFIVASIVSLAVLTLIAFIIAWLFGAAEFRIERFNKRD